MRSLLPEEKVFWEKHKHLIPARMAEAARKAKLDHIFLANRLKSYLKAKEKLPVLSLEGELIWPDQVNLEQSSSEITASYKASHFSNLRVIDLTGGFGIDTLAFAQHAKEVWHNEPNVTLSEICRKNLQKLQINNIKYFQDDAILLLSEMPKSDGQTLIYADPSRRDERGLRKTKLSQYAPSPSALIQLCESLDYPLLLKLSPMDSIPEMIALWPQLKEIHVLSVKNECKEILLYFNSASDQPLNIIANEIGFDSFPFVFNPEDEAAAPIKCGEVRQYLYDPFVSLHKAGPYKLLARTFDISCLHPYTHLYTSIQHVGQFPGRHFSVLKVLPAGSNELTDWFPDKKALIVVRNFPMSPDALYKKLKLKSGGERFLFAATDYLDNRVFIIAERIKQVGTSTPLTHVQ